MPTDRVAHRLVMRQRHTFCRAVAGGESFRAVARKYGVSEKTVRKWYRRWVGGRRSFHALMNSRPGPRTTRARADVEALVAELFPRFKGVRLRREMAKRGSTPRSPPSTAPSTA